MKLFIAENGSDAMIRFYEGLEDWHKVVSVLAAIEVRSAVRRRERAGEIRADHATSALGGLSVEMRRLSEQPVTMPVLYGAALVIDAHGLRALDAIQLATALSARNLFAGSEMQFVASDKSLLEAARAEGFSAWDPAES